MIGVSFGSSTGDASTSAYAADDRSISVKLTHTPDEDPIMAVLWTQCMLIELVIVGVTMIAADITMLALRRRRGGR